MTWGLIAVAGGSLIGGMMAGDAASDAAETGAAAQTQASQDQIAEARRQFDAVQAILKPYSDVGTASIGAQGAMMGLAGPEAEQAAITAIEQGPTFQGMVQQGENAILQNAAATGGLRGGNTQGALAQFRPSLLNQYLQQRFGNLQALTGTGQASAAGTAAASQATGGQVISALGDIGTAAANRATAVGQANAGIWSGVGQTASSLGTLRLMGKI